MKEIYLKVRLWAAESVSNEEACTLLQECLDEQLEEYKLLKYAEVYEDEREP